MRKKILCSVCLLLSLLLCVPAAAADATAQTANTATWLKAQLPQPALGDEATLLPLLRGSYLMPTQENVQNYLRSLQEHLENGGAEIQSYEQSAMQAMVLGACGIPLAQAPALAQALLAGAGQSTQNTRMALLLAATSTQAEQALGLDTQALSGALTATQNEDGGFGEGTSNALDTALALQALASYRSLPGVSDALLYAEMWLQLRTNDEGGFNMGSAPSAEATAQAMLAMACMGYNPELISADAAPLSPALLQFQNTDGGFAAAPGQAAELPLTALCGLALVAKTRYDLGKSPIFDFTDVPSADLPPVSSPGDESAAPSSLPLVSTQEKGGLPLRNMLLIAAAVVLVAGGGIILLLRKKDNRR